jgi:hypothetical protein
VIPSAIIDRSESCLLLENDSPVLEAAMQKARRLGAPPGLWLSTIKVRLCAGPFASQEAH